MEISAARGKRGNAFEACEKCVESENRKRQIYTSKTSLFGVFRGELISPKGILESVFPL